MPKVLGPPLPAQPFIDWCNDQIERLSRDETIASHTSAGATAAQPTHVVLANRLGIVPRTLYRYLNALDGSNRPTETFGMYAIEDMLEHAGMRLADLYPETEVDLEPDAYCSSCRDLVTPINDQCPWCERTVNRDKPVRQFCERCDAAMFPAQDGDCWRCGHSLRSMPWITCPCGCGTQLTRFDRWGREVAFARGHAPRRLERKTMVDPEPFAAWLESELRDLDPIQALARRVGLHRQELLDMLSRRTPTVEASRVRRSLWLAAREGQGKGMPPRPGATVLGDLYPHAVRSTTCTCGGPKAPHAELCRICRQKVGYGRRAKRPTSVTDDLITEAKRLHDDGMTLRDVGARLQPRTRCTNPMSVAHELRRQFRARGWPTTHSSALRGAA